MKAIALLLLCTLALTACDKSAKPPTQGPTAMVQVTASPNCAVYLERQEGRTIYVAESTSKGVSCSVIAR